MRMPFATAGVALLFALTCCAGSASAASCRATGEACAEWVTAGSGGGRTRIYTTHSLATVHDSVRRVVILVHGGDRNAEGYFRLGLAAASYADAISDTVLIAPRFASSGGSCQDVLATDEVDWDCGASGVGGWRSGAAATRDSRLTSFDVMDAILLTLDDGERFPNLRSIVVAGFSAGGQFVQRYAAVNRVHDGIGPDVRYVVASPSSYLYLEAQRPYDRSHCTTDRWPYGRRDITGYAAGMDGERLAAQYIARRVTYLVGQLDGPDAPALDASCAANAQGRSRLERAQNFAKAMAARGAKHELVVVGQCGHHPACILIGREARSLLFRA